MAALRRDDWLFAVHRFFTWKPRVEDYDECGWSVWWLWFEVARVSIPPGYEHIGGQLRPTA